jgi:hypothetical protein
VNKPSEQKTAITSDSKQTGPGELTDEQLDKVAGGGGKTTSGTTTTTTGTTETPTESLSLNFTKIS